MASPIADSSAGNLPAAVTSFVGRRRELAELRRLLRTTRLLTLTGMGGIGKTRLALETVAGREKSYPGGVWLVDLAPVHDTTAVPSAVTNALGLPDPGARPVVEQLIGHLSGRRALIVLDNCEHLVDACAQLVTTLLTAAPGLRILATGRQTLGVSGELVFAVPALQPEEAVDLVRDRTTAVNASFRITEANREHVVRLCADLDGLPLAIELAASRLRTLSVEQVVDRLEDRFALLSGSSRAALPRQRTLRAAIGWSYELCTPAERLLWSRLSIFAGDFAADAADGVCAGHGISPNDVVEILQRLVSQSLVLTVEREGRRRYRLLETIRQYGRERLAESGEEGWLLRRHRHFFLDLAERMAAEWYGPGQEEALARLRAEHTDLLAALERGWSAQVTSKSGSLEAGAARPAGPEPGEAQTYLALVGALRFHWCCNGFLGEGRRQFERLLAAVPDPVPARAVALWSASWAAVMQGDLKVADRWLDEADELGERLNDPLIHAYVLGIRGSSRLYGGSPVEAAHLLDSALAALSALGKEPARLMFHFQLALAQLYLGDPRAAQTGRSAVTAAETCGEQLSRAYALWTLCYMAWLRGDPQESNRLAQKSLQIHRGFTDFAGVAVTLEMLAWSTAALGRHRQAARLLGALRPLTRELHGTSGGAFAEPHDRCEQAIIAAIGQDSYDSAFTEGCSYDTPQRALALALDEEPDLGQATGAHAVGPLSTREQEIAALVAKGLSNRQIASTVGRSTRTVDAHVLNILAKMGFGSRSQIATWWTARHTSSR
ncbi:ATP-binding protein [Streptomyces sp. NPDC002623]